MKTPCRMTARPSILAGLLAVAAAWSLAAADRPNIILIISDDHAWTDYGFMGHPNIQTPHIDRLASQGLAFTRGYVTSSLCSPSLATLLTGLYPHQHKITSNDPPLPKGAERGARNQNPEYLSRREEMIHLIADTPTLPKWLGQQGYASLQTGKWWLGDYRRGGFTQGMTHGDPKRGGRHGDDGLDIGRASMQPIYDFVDGAAKENRPFFVWYAPFLPHTPHNPPERLLAKYRDKAPTLPIAKYWAMIEWFDETCGQLLDFLDRRGLTENTLVAYVADNGWIQNPNANGFAPKSKQSQYDGGLRTPIILRWPGQIKPQKSDALAVSVDLAPTLLRAAGINPPPSLPGVDLLDEKLVRNRGVIFGECFTHDAIDLHVPGRNLRWRWCVQGSWKLIVPDPVNEPNAVVELYNLADDPHEERNLARQAPDRVATLRSTLDAWWNGR